MDGTPTRRGRSNEIRLGCDRRRPGLVIKEADLAEVVARAKRCLPLPVDDDRRAALGNDEEGKDARAPLTFAGDRSSLRESVLLELPGKALKLLPLEACQQGHLAEGVDLDRHGPGSYSSTCRTGAAADDAHGRGQRMVRKAGGNVSRWQRSDRNLDSLAGRASTRQPACSTLGQPGGPGNGRGLGHPSHPV